MKTTVYIMLMLLGLGQTVQAQSAKDVQIKLIEKIVGSWQLRQVVDSKSKKAKTEVSGITAFEFSPEGRYKSMSKTEAIDSGSYRLNEPQNKLYLESETRKEAPAEWLIQFKDDVLTLKPQGAAHAARLQYVFVRTKNGLSTQK